MLDRTSRAREDAPLEETHDDDPEDGHCKDERTAQPRLRGAATRDEHRDRREEHGRCGDGMPAWTPNSEKPRIGERAQRLAMQRSVRCLLPARRSIAPRRPASALREVHLTFLRALRLLGRLRVRRRHRCVSFAVPPAVIHHDVSAVRA